MVGGDDGGLWYSYDGGNRWWKANNLPVSQFYHVSTDNKDPYQVYGGLQDNSAWVGDQEYPGGITNSRWENLFGGDGFWAFSDPSDPNYAYAEAQGGYIGRVNRHTLAAARLSSRQAQLQGEAALQLEHADRAVAQREGHDLHRLAIPVPQPRPWRDLGPHLARPHDQRSDPPAPGAVGRNHGRQFSRPR